MQTFCTSWKQLRKKDWSSIARSEPHQLLWVYSDTGIHPDPGRIEDVYAIPTPQNKDDLQRFLELMNYVSSYIANFAYKVAPLRDLMGKNVPFLWQEDHQAAFTAIKHWIAAESCLQYYNPEIPATLEVDASQKGLRACLLQNDKPVAIASKSLSTAQSNYSNYLFWNTKWRCSCYFFGKGKLCFEKLKLNLDTTFHLIISSGYMTMTQLPWIWTLWKTLHCYWTISYGTTIAKHGRLVIIMSIGFELWTSLPYFSKLRKGIWIFKRGRCSNIKELLYCLLYACVCVPHTAHFVIRINAIFYITSITTQLRDFHMCHRKLSLIYLSSSPCKATSFT